MIAEALTTGTVPGLGLQPTPDTFPSAREVTDEGGTRYLGDGGTGGGGSGGPSYGIVSEIAPAVDATTFQIGAGGIAGSAVNGNAGSNGSSGQALIP